VLEKGQFLIPGFIDTHTHAPQFVFAGTGYDKTLLDWLTTYTFPHESAFKDPVYAAQVYEKVVQKLIRLGTTTATYYSTLHLEASKVLANVCVQKGQRALIGKVNMDRNSPDFYIETTQKSIESTLEFVKHVQSLGSLVQPIITPRFVPSCTSELMFALSNIAQDHQLMIQSHMSENVDEIEWVKSLHPDCSCYADVYFKHGLLNDRTLMAHCVHMTTEEKKLMLEKQVAIAHCPNSNVSLKSGICPIRELLDMGMLKIGLGTDVSGGCSPSMLDAMRYAIQVSKMRQDPHPITLAESFYMATLGGARALNMDASIGSFHPGKAFDAIIVNVMTVSDNPVDIYDHDGLLAMFEKFVYHGDDRNIQQVYVQGNKVKGS
jgi:guanine deaminase